MDRAINVLNERDHTASYSQFAFILIQWNTLADGHPSSQAAASRHKRDSGIFEFHSSFTAIMLLAQIRASKIPSLR